jgi:hypothetical protein
MRVINDEGHLRESRAPLPEVNQGMKHIRRQLMFVICSCLVLLPTKTAALGGRRRCGWQPTGKISSSSFRE